MQRDAHYAIIKIQRKLKPASSPNIDTTSDPSKLVIDLNTNESFFLQGNQLFYQDPEGTQELVIEGDADTQFNVTDYMGTISITLTLVRGSVPSMIRKAAASVIMRSQ